MQQVRAVRDAAQLHPAAPREDTAVHIWKYIHQVNNTADEKHEQQSRQMSLCMLQMLILCESRAGDYPRLMTLTTYLTPAIFYPTRMTLKTLNICIV